MSDIFHHYVGKDGKRPKLSAEQRKQQDARAELLREQTREKSAKATLAEADLARRRRELIDRDMAQKQASFLLVTFRERLLARAIKLPRKLLGKVCTR
jgi:hypothetical protein